MSSNESGPPTQIFSRPPYQLSAEQIADEFGVNVETGLPPIEAGQRLEKYGNNQLDGGEGVPIWKVLVKQVSNAM